MGTNLIIDIGNTLSKVAICKGNDIIFTDTFNNISAEKLECLIEKYDVNESIICSVRKKDDVLVDFLSSRTKKSIFFDINTKIPIKINYLTPKTLGADRVAAAIGAYTLYGEGALLVVDFGSAITIDLVVGGQFMGGNISPGALLRFKSLNDYTDKLPLCSLGKGNEIATSALSTSMAIESGVIGGIIYEIEGYISCFSRKYDKLSIIFTGGDGKYFAEKIKNTIFVNSYLVFVGLNKVLDHNRVR